MRNIANVVHDLGKVVDGLNSKLQVLTANFTELELEVRKELMDSASRDGQLIKDYLNTLKAEAQVNNLEKANIDS